MTDTTKPVKPGLRERRHADAVRLVTNLADLREQAIGKLVKLDRKLTIARRTLLRYERLIAKSKPTPTAVTPTAKPKPVTPSASATVEPPAPPPVAKPAPASGPLDPDMPDFLVRKPGDGDRKDAEAREAILAEQATRKRAKGNARVDKLKAKQRGDLKRMPLTGKAALAAIANR